MVWISKKENANRRFNVSLALSVVFIVNNVRYEKYEKLLLIFYKQNCKNPTIIIK